jgi:hypothetical protein
MNATRDAGCRGRGADLAAGFVPGPAAADERCLRHRIGDRRGGCRRLSSTADPRIQAHQSTRHSPEHHEQLSW